MTFSASLRRGAALALAGALVFATPVLFQPVLAPSWGSGPSLLAALLALNLLGGAVGARLAFLPGWGAALGLALALLSPWTSWALDSTSAFPAAALVFATAALAARWTVALLSDPPGSRNLWYALETAGGGACVLGLLVWGFAHQALTGLAHTAGLLAALGAVLSLRLGASRTTDSVSTADAKPESVTPAIRRFLSVPMVLSAWSGFQFFHSEVGWAHHFAQVHANSTLAFGIVALALLTGLPLGALAARRLPDTRALALTALAGGLLLPLSQDWLVSDFGGALSRSAFPWDLLLVSLAVLVPASAATALLYPWLLARLEQPRDLPALMTANLLGGLLGACVAGWISLPLAGLHASLWLPSVGWAVLALLAAPVGRSRLIAGTAAAALSVATWSLWSAPLAPRPDYQVLDRIEGWSGRVELVERGEHTFLLYNGSYALGGTRSVASQAWQARMAMALRPQAQDVFVLGLGTGITAGALPSYPTLRRVRVVELLPQVVELSRRHFGEWTHPLFSDPRFSVQTGDARTTLRDDPERYDLILGDLFLPWLPGAELLMGREHLTSVRDHLRPDGLFVQWLPLFQLTEPAFLDILATARSVFGEVHLFRENHDPSAPLIALVASPPGGSLAAPGASDTLLQTWTGSTSGMTFLEGLPPSTHDNRLVRNIASGGPFPGQPPPHLALTDDLYLDWIVKVFQTRTPDQAASLRSFGPQAWRQAARGFFLQQELVQRQRGNPELADTMAARAAWYATDSTMR